MLQLGSTIRLPPQSARGKRKFSGTTRTSQSKKGRTSDAHIRKVALTAVRNKKAEAFMWQQTGTVIANSLAMGSSYPIPIGFWQEKNAINDGSRSNTHADRSGATIEIKSVLLNLELTSNTLFNGTMPVRFIVFKYESQSLSDVLGPKMSRVLNGNLNDGTEIAKTLATYQAPKDPNNAFEANYTILIDEILTLQPILEGISVELIRKYKLPKVVGHVMSFHADGNQTSKGGIFFAFLNATTSANLPTWKVVTKVKYTA